MEGILKVAVVMLTVMGVPMVIVYVLVPLAKALGHRLEGAVGGDTTDLEALRVEVEHLRELHPRMAELEERLDFAERALLSARGSTAQLPEGEDAAR